MQTILTGQQNVITIWSDVVRNFTEPVRIRLVKRNPDVAINEPSTKIVVPSTVDISCKNRFVNLYFEEVPKASENLAAGLVYLRMFPLEWDMYIECDAGSGYESVYQDLAYVKVIP